MLDKSIPWHSVIMVRPASLAMPTPQLPEGYRLRPYRNERDSYAWAQIETAVGEFGTVEAALQCHTHYLAHETALRERQFFAINTRNEAVATATCWWEGASGIPCVHALACLPSYQGQGLGLATAAAIVQAASKLHPNKNLWLETQTWSWKAIGLYLQLGFQPVEHGTFNATANDYMLSLPLLQKKLSPAVYQAFVERTIHDEEKKEEP